MTNNPVNSEGLAVILPLAFQQILYLNMEHTFQTHSIVTLKGILDDSVTEQSVYTLSMEDTITIKDNDTIVFSGFITNLELEREGTVSSVTIQGHSRSILMDLETKSRSFQKTTTYQSILKQVVAPYGLLRCQKEYTTQQNVGLKLQYNEIDWDFCKRIASLMGAVLYPDIQSEKTSLFIGVPEGTKRSATWYGTSITKDIRSYLQFHAKDINTAVSEQLSITVHSTKRFSVGDIVEYEGSLLVIASVTMTYAHGLTEYTYQLRRKKGIRTTKLTHSNLKGISLSGTILDVKKDTVKLHFDVDASQSAADACWFPVAAGYTAEGSTGSYSSMDVGERVRLYIPSEEETTAYVRYVDKKDSGTSTHFADTTTKSYGTPHGNGVSFTPNSITVTAKQEDMYVKITQEDGIVIKSNEDITLSTGKNLKLEGKTIEMTAKDKIVLSTKQTSIIIDELTHFKG